MFSGYAANVILMPVTGLLDSKSDTAPEMTTVQFPSSAASSLLSKARLHEICDAADSTSINILLSFLIIFRFFVRHRF